MRNGPLPSTVAATAHGAVFHAPAWRRCAGGAEPRVTRPGQWAEGRPGERMWPP